MEEMYVLALDTVRQKIKNDDEMFPFYVVALYCLLCKYRRFKKIVVDAFLDTEFYLEHGSVIDILERHNKEAENMDEIREEEKEFDTYAVSSLGHEFVFDNKSYKVTHTRNKPYIVASVDGASFEKLLNSFCHEMGHIIKGQINGFKILASEKDAVEFYFRTGFSYEYYFTEDGGLYRSNQFGILDEAINVLQTTEALSEVSGLREFVTDKRILDFISELDFHALAKDEGYEEVVKVFRDLWRNERFKGFAENDAVTGDVTLACDFDSIGQDSLDILGSYLDELFDLVLDDEIEDRKNEVIADCSELIKAYNEKYKEYVKVK